MNLFTLILKAKKTTLLLFFLFSSTFVFSQKNTPEKYYRIEAKINKEQLKELKKSGLEADHFHYENELLTAEISKSDLKLLKSKKIPLKIKTRNLEKRIPRINKRINRREQKKTLQKTYLNALEMTINNTVVTPNNFELGSMGGFFTLEKAFEIIDKMQQKYPNLITQKSSIGTSVENRPIYMVKISDNPNIEEENEEEALFTALHHAREPIGLSQMIFHMWHLLENYETDTEIKTLVDNTALYFIPIINPDGYAFNESTNPNGGGFWRKNRKNNGNGTFGVDLNRNYGYLWEPNNPPNTSSESYRGPDAFSEPETETMRNFVNSRKFNFALNYHSFSNLLLNPWGYNARLETPDDDLYDSIGEYMTEENGYIAGTPFETLGAVDFGASDDWMYGEQTEKPKILALTPEVGSRNDGFWPASSRIVPLCEESFYFNMKLMRMTALYAKLSIDEASKSTDNLNGTINFDITRYSLKNANWTVRLASDSPFIINTGNEITINSLNMFSTVNNSFNYELSQNTPKNESIPVSLIVSNGIWEYTENINLIFNGDTVVCESPNALALTNITDTTASFEWQNTDNTNYKLRYRIIDTPTWTEINNLTNNNTTISNLIENTEYEIQIANDCSIFSNSLVFKTESSSILNVDSFEEDLSAVSRFYPNPVKETLYIELATENEYAHSKFSIFNTTGKLVQTGILESDGSINVSLLSPEFYFLIINTMNNTTKIKFIKN